MFLFLDCSINKCHLEFSLVLFLNIGLDGLESTQQLASNVNEELRLGGYVEIDSDQEQEAMIAPPTRGKRTRPQATEQTRHTSKGSTTTSTSREKPPPYKIPKRSNSSVWGKELRPEELQDDEIFDELSR